MRARVAAAAKRENESDAAENAENDGRELDEFTRDRRMELHHAGDGGGDRGDSGGGHRR